MGIVTPLHDLPYLSQDMVVMDMVETYHGCIFYLYSHGICGVITSDVNANIAIYSENANLACEKYGCAATNMHKNAITADLRGKDGAYQNKLVTFDIEYITKQPIKR